MLDFASFGPKPSHKIPGHPRLTVQPTITGFPRDCPPQFYLGRQVTAGGLISLPAGSWRRGCPALCSAVLHPNPQSSALLLVVRLLSVLNASIKHAVLTATQTHWSALPQCAPALSRSLCRRHRSLELLRCRHGAGNHHTISQQHAGLLVVEHARLIFRSHKSLRLNPWVQEYPASVAEPNSSNRRPPIAESTCGL